MSKPGFMSAMNLFSCHSEERMRRGILVCYGEGKPGSLASLGMTERIGMTRRIGASRKIRATTINRESGIGKLLLIFAAIIVLATPLHARSWRISNFQDTITVNSDGS